MVMVLDLVLELHAMDEEPHKMLPSRQDVLQRRDSRTHMAKGRYTVIPWVQVKVERDTVHSIQHLFFRKGDTYHELGNLPDDNTPNARGWLPCPLLSDAITGAYVFEISHDGTGKFTVSCGKHP